MIAGGSEAAVCKLGIAGFCAARSLSTSYNNEPESASRPWDKNRDGFVMGRCRNYCTWRNGICKKKRCQYIWFCGLRNVRDAHHITSPAEDGDGGFRAMKSALEMSKFQLRKLIISMPGTSTKKGDEIELNAISRLFKHNIEQLYCLQLAIFLVLQEVQNQYFLLCHNNNICQPL